MRLALRGDHSAVWGEADYLGIPGGVGGHPAVQEHEGLAIPCALVEDVQPVDRNGGTAPCRGLLAHRMPPGSVPVRRKQVDGSGPRVHSALGCDARRPSAASRLCVPGWLRGARSRGRRLCLTPQFCGLARRPPGGSPRPRRPGRRSRARRHGRSREATLLLELGDVAEHGVDPRGVGRHVTQLPSGAGVSIVPRWATTSSRQVVVLRPVVAVANTHADEDVQEMPAEVPSRERCSPG